MGAPTVTELREWRRDVANRLGLAECRISVGIGDPISHRIDEYRDCIAELDAWITEVDQ